MRRRVSALAVSAALVAVDAAAQSSPEGSTVEVFRSDRPTALVELYTSEGCSSCPPADEWLLGLKDGMWRDFVPVAFHVDYWDYLGWKDVFSNARFSARHHDYGEFWKARSVFTPSVVVDGKLWDSWRQSRKPAASTHSSETLAITVKDRRSFELIYSGIDRGCMVGHVALLVTSFTSRVAAGENRGRELTHAFAAIDLQDLPLVKTDGMRRAAGFFGKRSFKGAAGYAVAGWVSPCESPGPLQAVGGPLRSIGKT